jgi:hypothetical protein
MTTVGRVRIGGIFARILWCLKWTVLDFVPLIFIINKSHNEDLMGDDVVGKRSEAFFATWKFSGIIARLHNVA